MKKVLVTWVGETDMKASKDEIAVGLGPIAQAVTKRAFDHIVLLSNYASRKPEVVAFKSWIEKKTEAPVELHHEKLRTPTDYADIYRVVSEAVPQIVAAHGKQVALTFHLSPGTPAMASIWILVAAKYGANLIQTSREQGLQDANVPFEIAAEFVPSLVRAADADLERLSEGLRPEEPEFADIYYRSEAMKQVVARAKIAAPYGAPILLEGESGTGKELFAAAIHKASGRKGPFVAVNCGALPRELVESAFFGHKKGTFTGAVADQQGHFERAQSGTLFLDEIGELPVEAQVKLLRALQEKKVQRIGEAAERPIDVRLIAATNRDLLADVGSGRFREDLYFRLAMLVLKTPPLRDRDGDIGLLAERFLERINADEGPRLAGQKKKLSAGAKNLLMRHSWPGNVRELQATLLRAVVWSKKETIEERDVRDALVSPVSATPTDVLNRPLGNGFRLQESLKEVVRHYLQRAIREAHGSKTKAASLVGFANYQTLSNWLRKYGVEA
jgi:transcriptional regulator with PAS, ATPase and Fis domain